MEKRRKFLVRVGTGSTIAIAGCSNRLDGEETGELDDTNGASDGEEIDKKEKETETSHQVGDTIIVEEGENSIEYIINGATTYKKIGEFEDGEPIRTAEPTNVEDGVWVVVELQITNNTDESITVSENIAMRVPEGRSRGAIPLSTHIEWDDRIDLESVRYDQLESDASVEGVLLYAIPEGEQIELVIGHSDVVELGST